MKKKIWRKIVLVFMMVVGCLYGDKAYAANDSFVTATKLPVNQFITDRMESSSKADNNYYTFTLNSRGYISIDFNHQEQEENYKHWDVIIYNSNRQVIKEFSAWGAEAYYRTNNIGLEAGTYYLLVTNEDCYTKLAIDYNLKVNYVVSDSYETEHNNGFTLADVLLLNKKMYGSMMGAWTTDHDYYTFYLPKNGYVKFEFNIPCAEEEDGADFHLYDANRNEIELGYEYVRNSEIFGPRYLSKGKYYIEVNNEVNYRINPTSENDYSIIVTYTTPKASISSAKSTSSKKMTVKWKKLKAVSGYEIITATDKKFKKNKKITRVSGSKKVKTTIKKLKRKKTYYVKMRGYITVDGQKYYGPYSKVKKVKVK